MGGDSCIKGDGMTRGERILRGKLFVGFLLQLPVMLALWVWLGYDSFIVSGVMFGGVLFFTIAVGMVFFLKDRFSAICTGILLSGFAWIVFFYSVAITLKNPSALLSGIKWGGLAFLLLIHCAGFVVTGRLRKLGFLFCFLLLVDFGLAVLYGFQQAFTGAFSGGAASIDAGVEFVLWATWGPQFLGNALVLLISNLMWRRRKKTT